MKRKDILSCFRKWLQCTECGNFLFMTVRLNLYWDVCLTNCTFSPSSFFQKKNPTQNKIKTPLFTQARSFQVWFHCVTAGNSLPLAAGYRWGDIVGFFQLLSLIHLSFRHVTSFSSSFLNYPVISISSKQPHMIPSTFLYRLGFCFMSLTVFIDWGRQTQHQHLPLFAQNPQWSPMKTLCN